MYYYNQESNFLFWYGLLYLNATLLSYSAFFTEFSFSKLVLINDSTVPFLIFKFYAGNITNFSWVFKYKGKWAV